MKCNTYNSILIFFNEPHKGAVPLSEFHSDQEREILIVEFHSNKERLCHYNEN